MRVESYLSALKSDGYSLKHTEHQFSLCGHGAHTMYLITLANRDSSMTADIY